VASETGRAQTGTACCTGVVGPLLESSFKLNFLEREAIAGDSPVDREMLCKWKNRCLKALSLGYYKV
jgi:hypothetical protein